MAVSYLGSWSDSIHPLSMDHHLSLILAAATGQAPAPCMPVSGPWHNFSCLARANDGGAAGHASVAWTRQLSASRSWHKLASGIICRDFLRLECVQGSVSPQYGMMAFAINSLHATLINIGEGAKQICPRSSPKPACSLAQLYNEGWKVGSNAGWEQDSWHCPFWGFRLGDGLCALAPYMSVSA